MIFSFLTSDTIQPSIPGMLYFCMYFWISVLVSNKEELAGVINCHAVRNNYYAFEDIYALPYDWRSFHFSRSWALNNWTQRMEGQNADDFTNILLDSETDYYPMVLINGEEISCWEYSYY